MQYSCFVSQLIILIRFFPVRLDSYANLIFVKREIKDYFHPSIFDLNLNLIIEKIIQIKLNQNTK